MMNCYRICKYDPQYRAPDGTYEQDEWTDYSDIGKTFDGTVLTEDIYLLAEQQHIACITDLLRRSGVDAVEISRCENGGNWSDGQRISVNALAPLLQDCLRGNCWCVLTAPDAYVHFGYDYYVYVGCLLSPDVVSGICRTHCLFANLQSSPYAEDNE